MAQASALFQGQTPLAVRMRPVSLDEVAGQAHLLRPGSPLVALADPAGSTKNAVSVILWGPPGTGKTTLAQAIARTSGRRFVELSAVTAGVRDVREVMQDAMTQRDLYGASTILFLDEIHRFTKAQQVGLTRDLVERRRAHPDRQRGLTLEESGCRCHPSRLVARCDSGRVPGCGRHVATG